MNLSARDGATLSLAVLGHEFTTNGASGPERDWLVIEGRVVLADGRHWAFKEPCLSVGEAGALARWLRRPEGICAFSEPLLALRATSEGVEIQFSHESLPPWMQVGDLHDWLGLTFHLRLDFPSSPALRLGRAAEEWEKEASRHPARPVAERERGEVERLLLAALR